MASLRSAMTSRFTTHQLINPSLNSLPLIQPASPLGPPNIIPLNTINLFGDIHPFILGLSQFLRTMELPDEAGVGGKGGEEVVEDGVEGGDCYLFELCLYHC